MKNHREQIYLASLLHDIGKFYQRADNGNVSSSNYLTEIVKKQESVLLPSYDGHTTHKYALWTAQFIIDNTTAFKELIGAESINLENKDNFIHFASNHHLSFTQQSENGKIIKMAESLSSGMDRAFSQEALYEERNWNTVKNKRIVSILETIGLSKKELLTKDKWHHLPVGKINLSEQSFPQKDFDTPPDYITLWNEFLHDFKCIQTDSLYAFSETFLNLLFKYTSSIPYNTSDFTDISLFDHAKMTAAIAVCLYDIKQENKETEYPFLLIGGDLSGIQSYIYQIVSKYAKKI